MEQKSRVLRRFAVLGPILYCVTDGSFALSFSAIAQMWRRPWNLSIKIWTHTELYAWPICYLQIDTQSHTPLVGKRQQLPICHAHPLCLRELYLRNDKILSGTLHQPRILGNCVLDGLWHRKSLQMSSRKMTEMSIPRWAWAKRKTARQTAISHHIHKLQHLSSHDITPNPNWTILHAVHHIKPHPHSKRTCKQPTLGNKNDWEAPSTIAYSIKASKSEISVPSGCRQCLQRRRRIGRTKPWQCHRRSVFFFTNNSQMFAKYCKVVNWSTDFPSGIRWFTCCAVCLFSCLLFSNPFKPERFTRARSARTTLW